MRDAFLVVTVSLQRRPGEIYVSPAHLFMCIGICISLNTWQSQLQRQLAKWEGKERSLDCVDSRRFPGLVGQHVRMFTVRDMCSVLERWDMSVFDRASIERLRKAAAAVEGFLKQQQVTPIETLLDGKIPARRHCKLAWIKTKSGQVVKRRAHAVDWGRGAKFGAPRKRQRAITDTDRRLAQPGVSTRHWVNQNVLSIPSSSLTTTTIPHSTPVTAVVATDVVVVNKTTRAESRAIVNVDANSLRESVTDSCPMSVPFGLDSLFVPLQVAGVQSDSMEWFPVMELLESTE